VTIIEIGTNSVEHRHVSVARPAPVLRLPATGSGQRSLLIEDLDAALRTLVGDVPLEDSLMGLRPFVYLEMAATDAASVITAEAAAQVKARGLRLAGIRVRREVSKEGNDQTPQSITNLKDTEPEILFSEAYLTKNGIPPEERHLTAFRDALAEL
jgi:exonuclease SbcD